MLTHSLLSPRISSPPRQWPLALCSSALLLGALAGPVQPQGEPSSETVGLATASSRGPLRLGLGGSPRLGEPFHVQIDGAQPGALGLFAYSLNETPFFFPALGGTIYPGAPLSLVTFVADARGNSPRLADMPAVPAILDGVFVSWQGAVADSVAQGGVALTKGGRLVFGSTTSSQALTLRSFPATSGVTSSTAVGGDWDADGNPDVVVSGSSGIWVLMGLPDGTLGTPQQIPAENGGLLAVVADMNADGIPDLVLEEAFFFSPGLIKVLLGNGDGTFAFADSSAAGIFNSGLVVDDFDLDGMPDIAVLELIPGQVRLIPGNGDGTLGVQTSLSIQGGPLSMGAGDLEADGIIDLVVNTNAGLVTLSGVGNGSFVVQPPQPTPLLDQEFAVRDVDGDSLDDVVGVASDTNSGPRELLILKGGGDGTFSQVASLTAQGENPANPQVVDLDSDGILDLLVDDQQISGVEVFFGQGNGGYDTSRVIVGGSNTLKTLIQDRDNDGTLDLVFLNGTGSDLNVALGVDGRSFSANTAARFSRYAPQSSLGHWDGDQVTDFLAINSNALLVLRGTGDGGFEEEVLTPLTTSQTPAAFALGDLDGDGLDDLLLSLTTGVFQFHANGSLGFDPAVSISAHTPLSLIAMDIDQDGIPDLVSGVNDGGVSGSSNELILNLGQGDGSFGSETRIALNRTPDALVAMDVNGDDFMDLLLADTGSNALLSLINQGDGTFAQGLAVLVGGLGGIRSDPVTADWNEDGVDDVALVAGTGLQTQLAVWFGDGNGGFGAPLIVSDAFANVLGVGDWNGDRHLDLAVDDTAGVTLFYGAGDGTFPNSELFGAPASSFGLFVADLNGDLLDDISIPSTSSASFSGFIATTLSQLLGR